MRGIVAYTIRDNEDGTITLFRCKGGNVEDYTVADFDAAADFLTQYQGDYIFSVCFSLKQFTDTLFKLLPNNAREDIKKTDRIFLDDCKIFYVPSRYLGLTLSSPVSPGSNIIERNEINIQALKLWVSDEETEPADAYELWLLGIEVVKLLERMSFYPTKLTSPVSVYMDNYLGDPRQYPTIFNFNEDWFEAMEYATEMMRYEWRCAYQIGAFDKTYSYDLNNAYPAAISRLPSTNDCRCEKSNTRPDWATWGIMKGHVIVDTDISPLVLERDGERLNPRGTWPGYFTTSEIDWLKYWQAGHFLLEDGWFFSFGKDRPFKKAMDWLFRWRYCYEVFASTVAKKMAQGVSGKLDEDRHDGNVGDWYNPILAAMVRSHCRLKVGNFIYNHKLQDDLIAVVVDNVLSTQEVQIESNNGAGNWRYEGEAPALVLSKGNIWRPGKRPKGLTYEQVLNAIKQQPELGYYEFKTESGRDMSIDLLLESRTDRDYEYQPECGGDVLNRVSKSQAVVLT